MWVPRSSHTGCTFVPTGVAYVLLLRTIGRRRGGADSISAATHSDDNRGIVGARLELVPKAVDVREKMVLLVEEIQKLDPNFKFDIGA